MKINVLGMIFELKKLKAKDKLPLIYSSNYDIYVAECDSIEFVLLHYKGTRINIDGLQKQVAKIQELIRIDLPYALWFDVITPTMRERFVQNKIPFFVSENYLYLPFLCAIFIDEFKPKSKTLDVKFTKSTQCVFLNLLYRNDALCPTDEIMQELDLTRMTVTRALLTMQEKKLLTVAGNRATKRYEQIEKNKFWLNGKEFLQSPVHKKVYVESLNALENVRSFIAGEEALASLTMLNEPEYYCRAIHKDEICKIKGDVYDSLQEILSDQYVEVELWNYAPGLFAKDGCVDIFSLYSSLGETREDVRVEAELDSLLKEWFDDRRKGYQET